MGIGCDNWRAEAASCLKAAKRCEATRLRGKHIAHARQLLVCDDWYRREVSGWNVG